MSEGYPIVSPDLYEALLAYEEFTRTQRAVKDRFEGASVRWWGTDEIRDPIAGVRAVVARHLPEGGAR